MADRDFIVTGERAALGMLRREHLPALASWFNDPEVRRGLAHRGVVNVEAEEKWFETMAEAGGAPRPSAVAFAIHAADDGELVGVCSLEEIDHNFLRAEFGIFMGRRRGEGIGRDAVRPGARLGLSHHRPAQRDARNLRLQRSREASLRARRLQGDWTPP